MENQKRKAITLEHKYDIQKIENGVQQSDICREMRLPKSTVFIFRKREMRFYHHNNMVKLMQNVKG